MIQWLMELVSIDTPSDDKTALDRFAERLGRQFQECGAQVSAIENSQAGNHLLVRYSSATSSDRPILILGHLDTVWSAGESTRRPARIEEGKIYGPGAFDMRGGLTLMLALAHYRRAHALDAMRPVTILLDSDEEVGSRTARHLIESEALREPSSSGPGTLPARRGPEDVSKGRGTFQSRRSRGSCSCGC